MSAPCGTYSAASEHRRQGEPLDPACAAAAREYMQQWRKTQAGKASVKREAAVRTEVLRRLIAAHPGEYRRIRAAARAAYDRGELS